MHANSFSLETNVKCIAGEKQVLCWIRNAFDAIDERIYEWRRKRLALETNTFILETSSLKPCVCYTVYTLLLIGTAIAYTRNGVLCWTKRYSSIVEKILALSYTKHFALATKPFLSKAEQKH